MHAFPILSPLDDGRLLRTERRLYDDVVTLTVLPATVIERSQPQDSTLSLVVEKPFPNPFNATVLLRYWLPGEAQVLIDIYDSAGRAVRSRLVDGRQSGYQSVEWNARDDDGRQVASGIYVFHLRAGDDVSDSVTAVLVK